jgi:hypothetical protein
MQILIKSFFIVTAALCLTLGIVFIAPLVIAGAADGTWKAFRNP